MNNLKDFANDTVIKDLALECKQYRELIPRLYDDLAAVKKAHKEAVEFNYDLAEENIAVHTKVLAMQERIAELEARQDKDTQQLKEAWIKTANQDTKIAALKEEMDLYKRQHAWECEMAAKRLNTTAGKQGK